MMKERLCFAFHRSLVFVLFVSCLLAVTVLVTGNSLKTQTCEGGKCVKYHLCFHYHGIYTDNVKLIDIRFDLEHKCVDYLLKCCSIPEDKDEQTFHQPVLNTVEGEVISKMLPATSVKQLDKSLFEPPIMDLVNVAEKCGRRNAGGVGFTIFGGHDGETDYGEFPWMVAILREERAQEQVFDVYQCGGSLIHPSVVLTAAHCVQNRTTEEVKVRLGEWDTQTKNELFDYQDRNVVEILSHAEFYREGLFNDVALLFLETPADLMQTVNTICLPPTNYFTTYFNNYFTDYNFDMSRCFTTGWGKDVFGKQGTYQVILKKIELPIMPRKQCQKALRTTRLGWRFNLHSSFICAGGEKGRDTCKGDGGSPLICPISGSNNHYYQAGIVAWGIGCGEDRIPGVYVNVPMFRGLIDNQLIQRNLSNSFYNYYN